MKLRIWALIENCVRTGRPFKQLGANQIQLALRQTGVLSEQMPRVLRTFLRLLPLQRTAWDNFFRLLKDEEPALEKPFGPPGPLTIGKVAKRQDARLVWASAIAREVTKQYFSGCRVADLFASVGDWVEAFQRYRDTGAVARPINSEDIPDTQAAVRALSVSLELEAEKGPAYIEQLAISGCRFLLGFDQVLTWTKQNGWKEWGEPGADKENERLMSIPAQAMLTKLGSQASSRPHGPLGVPEPWSQAVVCWVMPGVVAGDKSIFLAGDLRKRLSILPEYMPSSYFVPKTDLFWADQVLWLIKQRVYSPKAEELLSEIFGTEQASQTASGSIPRASTKTGKSRTYGLTHPCNGPRSLPPKQPDSHLGIIAILPPLPIISKRSSPSRIRFAAPAGAPLTSPGRFGALPRRGKIVIRAGRDCDTGGGKDCGPLHYWGGGG